MFFLGLQLAVFIVVCTQGTKYLLASPHIPCSEESPSRPRSRRRALALASFWAALFYLIIVFIFGVHEFYTASHPWWFYILVLLAYVGLCLISFEMTVRYGRISSQTWRKRDTAAFLATGFLFGIAGFFIFIPRWFAGYFGQKMAGDQLVFMFTDGVGGSTSDVDSQILHLMVLSVLALGLIGLCIGALRTDFRTPFGLLRGRVVRLCALFLAVLALVGGVMNAFRVLPLTEAAQTVLEDSTYIEENYVEPSDDKLSFPHKKRNLVQIYIESMETSYYDKEHGGYMEKNLMPDLMKLAEEGVSFSDTDKLGGPHQTTGSVHSVAGMMNQWAGVPLKSSPPTGSRPPASYADFRTMGDILHDQGYNTEIMMGPDGAWGGTGPYYAEHGNFTVFDHPYAIKKGLIPPDYKEWWGYEDDKMYAWAKDEMTRLAEENKPFYFVLETTDTHFPDGYVSKNMKEKPFTSQYANVIFYSQKQVADFVAWMKTQPFWEDTTVVVTGDHLSMDHKFFQGWDPSYERHIMNIYLNGVPGNPGEKVTRNRDFAPFDFFPTTLAALGIQVEGERAGLGTNLYSGKETLIERDGLDTVNEELNKFSRFYQDHRH